MQHLHVDTTGLEQLFLAHEGLVFANNDALDAVQQDRPAAHRARRQGGVQGGLGIEAGGLAPGVFQGVHFAVQDRAALLHAAVMAASDDPVVVHQYRTDRYAALITALLGLFDGCLHERIHGLGHSAHPLVDSL
ncbi:hypothetical protein D3C85_1470660 [compost metagenome]